LVLVTGNEGKFFGKAALQSVQDSEKEGNCQGHLRESKAQAEARLVPPEASSTALFDRQ
jgi:hypothetical protein